MTTNTNTKRGRVVSCDDQITTHKRQRVLEIEIKTKPLDLDHKRYRMTIMTEDDDDDTFIEEFADDSCITQDYYCSPPPSPVRTTSQSYLDLNQIRRSKKVRGIDNQYGSNIMFMDFLCDLL